MSRKIAFIGASYLFVPRTMRDILLNGNLEDSEITIYDIDPDPLNVVFDLCARMIKQRNSSIKLVKSKSRRAALEGADYVVVSVLAGGLSVANEEDKLCRKHRIRHTVGDTIGPMCTARVLRQIPLMLDIAKDMEKHCPDAFMLSPTNPMAAITTAVNRHTSIRCVGICHGTHWIIGEIARAYKVDPLTVDLNVIGINHLAFVERVCIKGQQKRMDRVVKKVVSQQLLRHKDPAGYSDEGRYALEYAKRIGFLPNNGDHHFIEFFPWFLSPASFIGRGKSAYGLDDKLLNVRKRI